MGRKFVQVLRFESVLKSALEAGNVRNARDDPFRFDKIVWSINFRHSSNPPSTSSISISVTTTNFNIKKSLSYIAKVTMNPLANDELAWWINNLELSNGRPIIKSLLQILQQTDASKKEWVADSDKSAISLFHHDIEGKTMKEHAYVIHCWYFSAEASSSKIYFHLRGSITNRLQCYWI